MAADRTHVDAQTIKQFMYGAFENHGMLIDKFSKMLSINFGLFAYNWM